MALVFLGTGRNLSVPIIAHTLYGAIVCVLKIVRELVSRLIQLDVIRAGHDHHDD
jgi:hypothetical protein